MTKSFEELEAERFTWSLKTFPKATAEGSLKKANVEVKEAIEALQAYEAGTGSKEDLAEELVDAIKCLFDCGARKGIFIGDIRKMFAFKLEKNKARIWKDNGDGSYSHVKEAIRG